MSTTPKAPQSIAAGATADAQQAITEPANVTVIFDRAVTLRIVAPDVKLEVVDPHVFH